MRQNIAYNRARRESVRVNYENGIEQNRPGSQDYMDAIQADVRGYPNFGKLLGENSFEYHPGTAPRPEDVYRSQWKLHGPHGTVTIIASATDHSGASLDARLTLAGGVSSEAVFGADRSMGSKAGDVVSTIKSWIDTITTPVPDPFSDTKLPSVS